MDELKKDAGAAQGLESWDAFARAASDWAGSDIPMGEGLAAALAGTHRASGMTLCFHIARLGAAGCAERAEDWIRAAKSFGSAPASFDLGKQAHPVVSGWALATIRPEPDRLSWAGAAPAERARAFRAGLELEAAWGLHRGSQGSPERQAIVDRGFVLAMKEALRSPRRDELSLVRAWLELGADPFLALGADVFGYAGMSPLDASLARGGGWRLPAMLAAAGATCGPGSVRACMDASLDALSRGLSDDGRFKLGMGEARARAKAALDLLGAAGSSVEAYRGKGGARYSEAAMRALSRSGQPALGIALGEAGVRLGRAAQAGAVHAFSRSWPLDASVIAALDSLAPAAGFALGPGPFGPLLGSLSSHAPIHSPGVEEAWGEAFARWGIQAGWGLAEASQVLKAWPELGATVFFAKIEAALIAPQSPGPTSPRRGPRSL